MKPISFSRRRNRLPTEQNRIGVWLRRISRRFPMLAKIVRISLFVGCTLAAVVVAGALLVGYRYHQKAKKFDLTAVNRLDVGSAVTDAEGREIGRIYIQDRVLLDYDEIPQLVIDAIVATEDARFFEHNGMDFRGILRSAWVNLRAGEIRQGASTITQQLARHVFHLRSRTYDRKLTEVFLAKRMERAFSKAEIFEHYVNHIYLGSGFYGIGAAAEGYFGKEVNELNAAEAATLAGIIKSPSRFCPFVDPAKAVEVRNLSLGRLRATGALADEEYTAACLQPMDVVDEELRDDGPFFALEATRREVNRRLPDRVDMNQGTVFTSMDALLIEASIRAIQSRLDRAEARHPELTASATDQSGPPARLEGAAIVIENETGRILAAIGGRDYRTSSFDYAFKGRRPAGTAFLPLTYAAYLQTADHHARAFVLDAPLDNRQAMIGGTVGTLGEWGTLSTRFEGRVPVLHAFYQCKTGAAIRVGNRMGVSALVDLAKELRVESPLRSYPSSFVGASPVRLIELARAYTALANDGVICPVPRAVDRVEDGAGEVHRLYGLSELVSHRALDRQTAALVRGVMVARMQQPAFNATLDEHGLGAAGLAGQPGSSYGGKDAWFIGGDRRLTCAVWVGHIQGQSIPVDNPGYHLAFPIWADIMSAALEDNPEGWNSNEQSPVRDGLCTASFQLAGPDCHHALHSGVIRIEDVPAELRPASVCRVHGPERASPSVASAVPIHSPESRGFVRAERERFPAGDPYGPTER